MTTLSLNDCNSGLTIQSVKLQSSLIDIFGDKSEDIPNDEDVKSESDSESDINSDSFSSDSPYGSSCEVSKVKTVKGSICEIIDSDTDISSDVKYVIVKSRSITTLTLPYKDNKENLKRFESDVITIKNKSPNVDVIIKSCLGNKINDSNSYVLSGNNRIDLIFNGDTWITL